jgi:ABC-type multidrug transport system ATPase subunit
LRVVPVRAHDSSIEAGVTSVIETERLTKRFRKTTAVDGVSFAVEPGQVFGFLGPNGSGKTTTIGMLAGIITPTSGAFRLFGSATAREQLAARRRMGATLEQPNFYPYLTGRQNLRIAANVKGARERDIDRALDTVGLAKRQKDQFKTYSLGMKQRLALAATMLGDPELVILDEPANGLDPEGMREIREVIGRLAGAGKTIFLSSHLLWEVERTCTHVAILKHGRILRQASVADIVAGTVVAELRGPDPARLRAIVDDFPGARGTRLDDATVVVELEDDDLAPLNQFVAERGMYLSHLALRQKSLEDVFMELTGADAHGMGEVA